MKGFSVLLGKELREQVRTYRLPVVTVVFLLFGITSPLLARYIKELFDALGSQATGGVQVVVPDPTVADAVDQLLKNLTQFGILIAILLAMGTVASEKDRGTAALILTKPASRLSFLLAKLAAIAVTLGVAVAAGCAIAAVYTLALFEGASLPVVGYAEMAALLWLMTLAYASLTFLGSTLTRSALAGAGIGFVALVVTGIVGALPALGQYMPTSLAGPAASLGVGAPLSTDLLIPIVATIGFVVIPFALAWLSFRRQEL